MLNIGSMYLPNHSCAIIVNYNKRKKKVSIAKHRQTINLVERQKIIYEVLKTYFSHCQVKEKHYDIINPSLVFTSS